MTGEHEHNAVMYRPSSLSVLLFCIGLACPIVSPAAAAEPIRVGSKRFTESYVLGEIASQTLSRAGVPAEHHQGLGSTAILEQALRSGQIDVYPEYTGTIQRELLKRNGPADAPPPTVGQLNGWLAPYGFKAVVPFGFNNTYAIAMREADAARLGLDSLSSLARLAPSEAARLRPGLSHEFMARADGWPALKRHYALALRDGPALDHGLAYQALTRGEVDLIDVYSTDAQIGRLGLRVLKDDRGFFPRYDAVLLMRAAVPAEALNALSALTGRIDEATMIDLNAAVELDGRSFSAVAQDFLDRKLHRQGPMRPALIDLILAPDLGRLVLQHLNLVFGSLLLAMLAGIPLGVVAHRYARMGDLLLALTGMLQTVPSLALLTFLIVLLGRIGFLPALLALSLYALLPIVRNTLTGLSGVPTGLTAAGRALGLGEWQVLRLIELPLSLTSMLAGVSTAAVINVGTATLAAFVGAGGLGERIVAGLAVNDFDRMLAGAIPAALLALLVQGLFVLAESLLMPTPLRRQVARSGRP